MEYLKSLITHTVKKFLDREKVELIYKGNFPRDLAHSIVKTLENEKDVQIKSAKETSLRCPDCGSIDFEEISREIKDISFEKIVAEGTTDRVDCTEETRMQVNEGRCKGCSLLIDIDLSIDSGKIIKAKRQLKNKDITKKKFADDVQSVGVELREFEDRHNLNDPELLNRINEDTALQKMLKTPLYKRLDLESLTNEEYTEYIKKMKEKEVLAKKLDKQGKNVQGKEMESLPPREQREPEADKNTKDIKNKTKDKSKDIENKNNGEDEPPRDSIAV